MEFTANGTKYIVDEYAAGQWFWTSADSESGFFDTAAQAQQDALANEEYKAEQTVLAEEERQENLKYGSYEDQVFAHHNFIIRH